MCGLFAPADPERAKDAIRGRDSDRFDKLEHFAEQRWRRTRDMQHALFWFRVMETIERRRPLL